MAINPMELLKLKERLSIFTSQHPKFPAFLQAVGEHAAVEGTVVEITVTPPDGKPLTSNIRLTGDDITSIGILKNLKS
ncbi:MAG: hypothetical protein LKJ76_11020 [Lachnospiraceae bacterium]|jgi:hypothetical protein|nr:hypothetical protein [Lachnospiraceae bacterium]